VQALDLGSCDSTSMLVGYKKTMTEDNRRQSVLCPKTLWGLNLLTLNPRPCQKTAHWLKGWVGESLIQ
jgi:hypothetical protein